MRLGLVGREDLASGKVDPSRRLLKRGRDEVLLEGGERDGAARLTRKEVGDLGTSAPYDRRRVEQEAGALGRRRRRPSRKSIRGGANGGIHVLRPARRDPGERRLAVRLSDLEVLAARSVVPVAAVMHLVGLD